MRIGPFDIRATLQFEIWEGRTLKHRLASLDEAIDLADTLWEEDREREERQQYGSDGIGSNEADDRWKMRREPA
jgi:hypothetical protein